MPDFLHGVETQELLAGPKVIQQVATAIMAVVGTAPIHHGTEPPEVGRPGLVLNDRANPKYGPDLAGYTIPDALLGIQAQGAGTVIVVNVFDPTVHKANVDAADLDVVDGEIQLAHADIISAVVKEAGGAGAALVEGTDYTIDRVTGLITLLAPLSSATELNVAYVRADVSMVDADDIVGTVDVGGVRRGAQALLDAASLYNMGPKILTAPGFSSDPVVRAALQVLAQPEKLRAVVFADVPVGTLRDEAIEGRGPEGEVDLTTSDGRVYYTYPHLTIGDRVVPYSPRMAGVTARTDKNKGYWKSPSNEPILGVTGTEQVLTAKVNDPQCDVNQLNAAGIGTVFAGFGTGLRTWGNRSSAFPGGAQIDTFLSVRRTIDMVDESCELAALAFIDDPTNRVLIDAQLDAINAFIRTQITRGALLPGSRVEYFEEDNPPSELAQGHVTFTKTYCPPPPCERITYKSVIDTTLLKF